MVDRKVFFVKWEVQYKSSMSSSVDVVLVLFLILSLGRS